MINQQQIDDLLGPETEGSTVEDKIQLLVGFEAMRTMFPQLTLAEYCAAVDRVQDLVPDVAAVNKAVKSALPAKKYPAADRLALLKLYHEVSQTLLGEGLVPQSVSEFLAAEGPLYLAEKAKPPSAIPCVPVDIPCVPATTQAEGVVTESDATLWISKADYLRASSYLQSPGQIGAAELGATLCDFSYAIPGGYTAHIVVANGDAKPYVDAYVRDAQGVVQAELPPRTGMLLGVYEFTLPERVWRLQVRSRGVL